MVGASGESWQSTLILFKKRLIITDTIRKIHDEDRNIDKKKRLEDTDYNHHDLSNFNNQQQK